MFFNNLPKFAWLYIKGARQLLGDEGLYLPNGKLLCLWK